MLGNYKKILKNHVFYAQSNIDGGYENYENNDLAQEVNKMKNSVGTQFNQTINLQQLPPLIPENEQEQQIINESVDIYEEAREGLDKMTEEIFLNFSQEQKLKIVSNADITNNLEGQEITFKFPTKYLEQKISAGEVFGENVQILKSQDKVFTRGDNGEFFDVNTGERLKLKNGVSVMIPTKETGNQMVIEAKQNPPAQESKNSIVEGAEKLSQKDFLDFAAMIRAEAGTESIPGRAGVGFVILNRMKFWKQSMGEVLFAKSQFSPISDGRFKKIRSILTESDKNFTKDLLSGKIPNPIGNATFFQNKTAENSRGNWQASAKTLTKRQWLDGHYFRTEKKFLNA